MTGVRANKFFIALTGHMAESPKFGIFKSLTESLLCIVFVYLIKRGIPEEAVGGWGVGGKHHLL